MQRKDAVKVQKHRVFSTQRPPPVTLFPSADAGVRFSAKMLRQWLSCFDGFISSCGMLRHVVAREPGPVKKCNKKMLFAMSWLFAFAHAVRHFQFSYPDIMDSPGNDIFASGLLLERHNICTYVHTQMTAIVRRNHCHWDATGMPLGMPLVYTCVKWFKSSNLMARYAAYARCQDGDDFLDHLDDLDFADGTVLGLQRGCAEDRGLGISWISWISISARYTIHKKLPKTAESEDSLFGPWLSNRLPDLASFMKKKSMDGNHTGLNLTVVLAHVLRSADKREQVATSMVVVEL